MRAFCRHTSLLLTFGAAWATGALAQAPAPAPAATQAPTATQAPKTQAPAATPATAATQPASQTRTPIDTGLISGVAIGGYDTVAYFTENKPQPGVTSITHTYNGVTWRFKSEANRALFAADPQKYAPQFGGYCAYAIAHGGTSRGDPNAWRIVDGKLYLNLSSTVQFLWNRDVPGNIQRGITNWPKIASTIPLAPTK